MANRCYLVGWDEAKGSPMKPSLELSYGVPLFWLAMFDPEELRDITLDGDAFVKPPGAPDDFEIETYLYTTATRALERMRARLRTLGAATDRQALATRFQKYMGRLGKRGLLLQVTELAWMQDAGTYAEQLRESLALVADPSTPAPRVLALIGGDLERDEHAENLVLGWGTQLTARERDHAKQRKKAGRAANEETTRTEHWQASVERVAAEARTPYRIKGAFQIDEVIEHAKFGPGVVVRVIDSNKIEVQFEHATSTLVQRHGT